MTRMLFCAFACLIATPAAAAPPPPRQLDHPVLAVGDVGRFRVGVPGHAGGAGSAAHAAFALMPGSSEDRGLRFFAVECPEGFLGNVHYEDRGVVCYRHDGAGYAPFEMVVHVLNTGATEGETLMPQGLRSLWAGEGISEAAWRIYGVVP